MVASTFQSSSNLFFALSDGDFFNLNKDVQVFDGACNKDMLADVIQGDAIDEE